MTEHRPDVSDSIRVAARELRTVAQGGVIHTRNPYDAERFQRAVRIAEELNGFTLPGNILSIEREVETVGSYTTPKIDVRGVVFDSKGLVLLVRERSEGMWSVPGGWCDVLETPREAVSREVLEESGAAVEVSKLAAVFDRERWGHQPRFDFHVYKLFFVCALVGPPQQALVPVDVREISDVGWFDVDRLPELSTSRVVKEQLKLVHAHYCDATLPTYFD
jgi:ADP-ribose pyrophosphatase YjhB (NUDIX family)